MKTSSAESSRPNTSPVCLLWNSGNHHASTSCGMLGEDILVHLPLLFCLAIGAGEIRMAKDRCKRPLIILVGPFQLRLFHDLWYSSFLGPCAPGAQPWSTDHVPWPSFALLGNPGAVATPAFLLELCLLQVPFLLLSPQNERVTFTWYAWTLPSFSLSADSKPQNFNSFKQLCF